MSNSEKMMIARDLVQTRLLGAIFAKKVKDGLALKGGLAMRILAKSERYTKDIDLAADPRILTPERIKARVSSALRQLKNEGYIDVVPATPQKDTETTIRYKVAGNILETAYDLTVEISRRDELISEHLQSVEYVDDQGFGFVVDCFDLNLLAASKIGCLASPKREAPRDIYDLAVLISMNVRPPEYLLSTINADNLKYLKESLWDKIEKMDYVVATEQLLDYLPKRIGTQLSEDDWTDLRLRVGYKVDNWVNEFLEQVSKHEIKL